MTAIDQAPIERRVESLSRLLEWHMGGLELAEVSDDGTVTVQFLGACRGCPLKPVTMAATVRDALLAVDGVTRVEAVGVRISEEAEDRLTVLRT